MTGDGVNDAPALKKADCGIAVSGATDAARAAAAIVLLTPGLSVIIDAIKESRRIFQRMNSYAIYRIAETLRVLLFMTLAIVVFNFYPLTAIMIVMLALLNDGAILSIAYDNVIYRNKPEAWDMHTVLGVSTVLGVIGVASASWPLLSRRARLPSGPRPYPNADVSQTVGGRSPHDFPDAHPRTFLVYTPRSDIVARGAGHTDGRDADRGLRAVHDCGWHGIGAIGVAPPLASLVLDILAKQPRLLRHLRRLWRGRAPGFTRNRRKDRHLRHYGAVARRLREPRKEIRCHRTGRNCSASWSGLLQGPTEIAIPIPPSPRATIATPPLSDIALLPWPRAVLPVEQSDRPSGYSDPARRTSISAASSHRLYACAASIIASDCAG